MHLTQSMFSTDPTVRNQGSALSMQSQIRYREKLEALHPKNFSDKELRSVAEGLKQIFDSSTHVFGSLKRFVGGWMGKGGALDLP